MEATVVLAVAAGAQVLVGQLAQEHLPVAPPAQQRVVVLVAHLQGAVAVQAEMEHREEQAAQESLSFVYQILLRRYFQTVSLLVLILYPAITFTRFRRRQRLPRR